jgi:hypothetical protein
VANTGEKRNALIVYAGKPEGKRPLGRLRHRRQYNIKIELKKSRGRQHRLD